MTKISIIVPVYNAEKFLEECLKSIVNQTLSEIEIICVNDGSEDGSVEIIKRFQLEDNRIVLIEQENVGGGAARNRGLQEARGEYLLFLDADDFFEPDMCAKAYQCALDKKADIVVFRANQFDMNQNEFSSLDCACQSEYFKKEIFCYKDNPDKIFNSFHNYLWNKLFSHDFVKRNRIQFQELHRTNDLLFTCSALVLARRITILDDLLVHYRMGYDGNCQTTNHKYPLDFYYAFKALKEFLFEQGIYEDVKKSFINWAMEGCVYNIQSIHTFEAFEKSFNFLKREGFQSLDIELRSKDFYYYPERYDALKKILTMNYDEYIFECLKEKEEEINKTWECLKERESKLKATQIQLEEIRIQLEETQTQLKETEEGYQMSTSFRIGRLITALPRWCRGVFGGKNDERKKS